MGKTQNIGYFVCNGKAGFYGGVKPDPWMDMGELWEKVKMGPLSPTPRSGYVPIGFSSELAFTKKWRDLTKPSIGETVTPIPKIWKKHRKWAWKYTEAVKQVLEYDKRVMDHAAEHLTSYSIATLEAPPMESEETSEEEEKDTRIVTQAAADKITTTTSTATNKIDAQMDTRKNGKKNAGGKQHKNAPRTTDQNSESESEDEENCKCCICGNVGKEHRKKGSSKSKLVWIECHSCRKWAVASCDELPPLPEELNTKWHCKRCRQLALYSFMANTTSTLKSLQEEITTEKEKQTRNMNKITESLNTVQNKLKEISDQPNLKAKVTSLESQLKTAKSSFKENMDRTTKESLNLLQEAQELRIQLAVEKDGRHPPQDHTQQDKNTPPDNKSTPREEPAENTPREEPEKKESPHPPNMIVIDEVNGKVEVLVIPQKSFHYMHKNSARE